MAFVDSMRQEIGLTKSRNEDGEWITSGIYGKEVCLDCYQCDMSKFNRTSLRKFFTQLVKLLGMKKGDLYFWDDYKVPKTQRQTRPETTGTSAVQFILTSNITVHCLDLLERVYINIFSCKEFSEGEAKAFIQRWFDAKFVRTHVLYRL